MARTIFLTFLYSCGITHNTYQRMGATGVPCTFIDKMSQVVVKEMEGQTGENSEAKTGNLGVFSLLWKFGL